MGRIYNLKNEIPWIVPEAISFLKERIAKNMTVLEFGSGGSTLWLARMAKSVTTYESDQAWASKVYKVANKRNLNINIIYSNPKSLIENFPSEKFNCIFIDNKIKRGEVSRNILLEKSIPLLKSPKTLILDNYGWFDADKIPDWIFLKTHGLSGLISIRFNDPSWLGKGTRVIYEV